MAVCSTDAMEDKDVVLRSSLLSVLKVELEGRHASRLKFRKFERSFKFECL